MRYCHFLILPMHVTMGSHLVFLVMQGLAKIPIYLNSFCCFCFFALFIEKNSVHKRWENIAFSLVLSGALGNVIDRLMFGYVVDFLDFDLGFYRWPTFNVADIVIFIGATMIILDSLLNSNKTEKENK
ncbi:signal peptidase II [Psychromonas sp. KJ10-10]|uniref:signal peptidase II n=1 Tax=Psychromonas sp. KJ10-10 TaxID=3391823 RepID=UPI0039B62E07